MPAIEKNVNSAVKDTKQLYVLIHHAVGYDCPRLIFRSAKKAESTMIRCNIEQLRGMTISLRHYSTKPDREIEDIALVLRLTKLKPTKKRPHVLYKIPSTIGDCELHELYAVLDRFRPFTVETVNVAA